MDHGDGHRLDDPDAALARALGFLVAGHGPLAIAGVLVPLRDAFVARAVALVLLSAVVITAALLAGHAASVAAAFMALLTFDFFFCRPYQELVLNSRADAGVAALFLTSGMSTAVLADRWGAVFRSRPFELTRSGRQSRRLERLRVLIERGADAGQLIVAVQGELTGALRLRRCHFEPGRGSDPYSRLERDGSVTDGHGQGDAADGPLPAAGLEVPVAAGGIRIGRFVMETKPDRWVGRERRIVALILVDHLGAALARQLPIERGSRASVEVSPVPRVVTAAASRHDLRTSE